MTWVWRCSAGYTDRTGWTGVVNGRPREDLRSTHFDEETGGEGGKRRFRGKIFVGLAAGTRNLVIYPKRK